MLPDNFRVNHRAASESLLRAASDLDMAQVHHELDKATYFENEAIAHADTRRQRALAIGLLHSVDLIRAVIEAESSQTEP